MSLVHFFTLEDLVAEVLRYEVGSKVVRVERLVRSQSTGTSGVAIREVAIAVRAVVAGELFSFWLGLGRVQTIHGDPFGPEAEFLAEALEDRGKRWESKISEYLAAEGLSVRPGLMDLGGAEAVSGEWLGAADDLAADRASTQAAAELRKGAR